MSVKVLIPTPLQKFTADQAMIECEGGTISELLDTLEQDFPGIKTRLCDEQGNLRRFINFYVNSEDIRFLDGKDTLLNAGDEVSIVPAVAGGWFSPDAIFLLMLLKTALGSQSNRWLVGYFNHDS